MDDEKLDEIKNNVSQYMDSLYQLTEHQLREEVRGLYIKCCMLNDCAARLKTEITKLMGKDKL